MIEPLPDEKDRAEALRLGFVKGSEQGQISDNPYPDNTTLARIWVDGWAQGIQTRKNPFPETEGT